MDIRQDRKRYVKSKMLFSMIRLQLYFWNDGTKTVVKCGNDDTFDPEKGLTMAISKYFFNNAGYYNDVFKKWIPKK